VISISLLGHRGGIVELTEAEVHIAAGSWTPLLAMIVAMEDQISWRATPYRAPVLDAGGVEVGQTASLLGDEEEDIFHGLAVKLAHGGGIVELPAARISRITRSAVQTDLHHDEVNSLEQYREERWYHLGWGGLFRKRPEWIEGE